jgi:membrane-bound lytic murein transglycosylase B
MTVISMPRPSRFIALLILPLAMLLAAALTPALAATHPGQAELVREVAQATGKDPAALNALLDGAKLQQSILDAISRPAEGKPWKDYRPIFLTDQRINDGIAFYRAHRALLEQVGQQYGVAPQYIVAIIGVETSYGSNSGKYKVLDALVTLGLYYPPRAKFFREQLKELLSMPANHLAAPLVRRRPGLGPVHAYQHPRFCGGRG